MYWNGTFICHNTCVDAVWPDRSVVQPPASVVWGPLVDAQGSDGWREWNDFHTLQWHKPSREQNY